ncbi:Ribosomal protein S18 acetylase RimI and related acetyltransferases (RimI) (PDB:1GHE) [Commensalibacter communis]|uniref:Ribosomal protein S18 acetylase RimI and related acetyltransferases (RimI) n=1 Tax=Commensalibacter communis TaxID=2972786 RepID=A0A9W4TP13_9PROT|nr:GNAT family N-acetyltransferase [Commensalibacter communis]CAI3948038.1 Ribosomal protein S18 acetylase RimI and related acetyltransferases (RimI) (PDB:1GHE) [Commensalibacter communis]CAI3948541.1 Ribosomal protein S18 acetylase RimI and related acetyltransferases (RimI) (PDB:1GHE) [Commensalibacter communis]CAI3950304.1 Ribosomal protein S18 acetylase RimI and related acetyltransferases (RimI) (PDB:1GHE) [Commensalibacter communis]CAI3954398.1 Ribosomal protein S18 acetylase RimI and relat
MSLNIREFRENDATQFLEIVRYLQAYELAIYDRMKPVEAIDSWYIQTLQEQCQRENGYILVAELDSVIVGFATIFTKVPQRGEFDELDFTYGLISHISVSPQARGLGVGKQLMQACEQRAKDAGCKWLRIPALGRNQQARAIYEHLGFEEQYVVLEKCL